MLAALGCHSSALQSKDANCYLGWHIVHQHLGLSAEKMSASRQHFSVNFTPSQAPQYILPLAPPFPASQPHSLPAREGMGSEVSNADIAADVGNVKRQCQAASVEGETVNASGPGSFIRTLLIEPTSQG